jgi:energy-coupling factor transporter transmembrane protein EcfT
MHKYLYFSLAVIVITVALGFADKERRRMWFSLAGVLVGALIALALVAWFVFETQVL